MTNDSADDSTISNRTITTNRISNRTYDSKSNRITKLRRSLVLPSCCQATAERETLFCHGNSNSKMLQTVWRATSQFTRCMASGQRFLTVYELHSLVSLSLCVFFRFFFIICVISCGLHAMLPLLANKDEIYITHSHGSARVF